MLAKIINLISDNKCLICSSNCKVVCKNCDDSLVFKVQSCFGCNSLSENGKTCPRCQRKFSLNGATVVYRLDDKLAKLIYQLKYFGRRDLANFFASKMHGTFDITKFDIITFVPADGRSQRKRGYNQAKLVARAFLGKSDAILTETLLRCSHTAQVGQGREQRFKSVKDNFLAKMDLDGKRVLIIDDVLTTGATLNECARILKQAGARQVWGLVVAKK